MARDRRGAGGTAGRVAVLVVLLIALSVPAVATTPSDPGQATLPLVGGTDLDPDSVLMAVSLQNDGSAQWRVEYRVRLDNDNVTRAFESLKRDIEADPASFSEPFGERMAATAAAAENATGREMTIRNVTVSADRRQLPQEYGVVSYTFEWTGFAVVEDDRLRAGDAVAGLFLDQETTLLVSWPSSYRPVRIAPTPEDRRDGAVAWTGRLDFAAGEPRLVLTTAPPTETTSPAGGDGDGGGAPPGDEADGGGIDAGLVGLAIIALLLVGGGVWWVRRTGSTDSPDGTTAQDVGDRGEDGGPPEELLSNEERVLSLLDERGGRMKQQEVAQALDWTDAKTSQVVGDLRDSGRIESFRLGRENVLSLPDEDHAGSSVRGDDT